MDQLKIDSQVSTDDDKEEFMTILRTGEVKKDQFIQFDFLSTLMNTVDPGNP